MHYKCITSWWRHYLLPDLESGALARASLWTHNPCSSILIFISSHKVQIMWTKVQKPLLQPKNKKMKNREHIFWIWAHNTCLFIQNFISSQEVLVNLLLHYTSRNLTKKTQSTNLHPLPFEHVVENFRPLPGHLLCYYEFCSSFWKWVWPPAPPNTNFWTMVKNCNISKEGHP